MLCEVCKRDVEKLCKHHTIPRVKGGKGGPTAKCCKDCSVQIHMLFTERELADMAWKQLLGTKAMQKYIKWVQKKNPEANVRMRMSKRIR